MFLTWTMPLGSLSIVPLDMGYGKNWQRGGAFISWIHSLRTIFYLSDPQFLEWRGCNRTSSH